MTTSAYTSTLNAGLGMIAETRLLLALWHPGMSTADLQQAALASGQFPKITARRLRNLVVEGFAPCYLIDEGKPALVLQQTQDFLTRREFEQLLYIYTCRAHAILADFVSEVYWPAYTAGRTSLSNEDARAFVTRANQDGRNTLSWSTAQSSASPDI